MCFAYCPVCGCEYTLSATENPDYCTQHPTTQTPLWPVPRIGPPPASEIIAAIQESFLPSAQWFIDEIYALYGL